MGHREPKVLYQVQMRILERNVTFDEPLPITVQDRQQKRKRGKNRLPDDDDDDGVEIEWFIVSVPEIAHFQGWVAISPSFFSTGGNEDSEANGDDGGSSKDKDNDSECPLTRASTCYHFHKHNTLRALQEQGHKVRLRLVSYQLDEVIMEDDRDHELRILDGDTMEDKLQRIS